MADLSGFDATKVEPSVGFDVLPAGEYDVVITASALKPTSKGDGKYLELEFQILSGQYQNRKLWDRLNIQNPNAQAQQIALGSLSAICRAVGVLTPKDSAELHGKPLRVKVKIERDEQYGDKNRITTYKSRAVQPTTQVVVSSAPAAQPW